MFRVVAIDGPAASGKSSVAREIAAVLGFAYVNSGALYRAVTHHVLQNGVDLTDDAAIAAAAASARLLLDDPQLRDAEVNVAVSRVSSVPRVREILNAQMHAAARRGDVVVEGRDIGSVVFPETPFKFYLDAAPDVRAQRRAAQGEDDQISVRDRADSSRAAAPLVAATDANVIDTSQLTLAEVVAEILRRLAAKNLRP